MSVLCRMAQGRDGADRLIESHLITALAQCDFIDARPEMDQAFVGMSTHCHTVGLLKRSV